jgi:DNA-directed RNA polymerase specialized sigma24 family protein
MGDDPVRSSCEAEPIAIDWTRVRKSVKAKIAGKLLPLGIPEADVEDLVQDICFKASRKFDPSKIRHPEGVFAFVQAIAANALKDYFEQRRDKGTRHVPLNETVEDDRQGPATICNRISAAEFINKIFDGQNGGKPFKKEERELLMKALGEETPYEEIQKELRDRGLTTSRNALRQKVYRLVRAVRQSWPNTK